MASKQILATFEGTYKISHPEGYRGQQVTKPFKCRVKIPAHYLKPVPNVVPALRHISLTAVFATYYKAHLKKRHPEMIDLYRWRLDEATELDGTIIEDPKCLSYPNLLEYIKKYELNVNPLVYPTDQELRDAILLHEDDEKGQQRLQKRWEQINGPTLKAAQEIAEIEDVFEELDPSTISPRPFKGIRPDNLKPTLENAMKARAKKKTADDIFAEPEEADDNLPGVEIRELNASTVK